MNKCRTLLLLLLNLLLASTALAQIKMGIQQKTVSGATNHIRIFYVAQSDYSSAPFNIWNSQVFSLRWASLLGGAVISSISNPSTFSFALDGTAADGGDGYYYQKLTSSSTAITASVAMGDTLEVLVIEVSHASIATGDFELITTPNTWVTANFGTASVNAAVGGDQFDSFDPAIVLAVPLPLELLAFEARAKEAHILLDWRTVNEESFTHFILERSDDGHSFEALASFNGQGLAEAYYRYEDWKVLPRLWYYYRLKMVDQNGTYTYSPIRSAQLKGNGQQRLAVYPNPVSTEAIVVFDSPFTQITWLSVVDASGQVVVEKQVAIQKGAQQFSLLLKGLPAGFYTVHIGQMDGEDEWKSSLIKVDDF